MKLFKTIALALCCCILFSFNGQAQNEIGGRLGVNFATWAREDALFEDSDPKRIIGIHAALAFQIGITEMISIQPELTFIQKGFKQKESFFGFNFEQVVNMNYLEVPILIKLRFPLTEQVGAFVNAGPSIGYALSGTFTYDDGVEREREDIDFDDNDSGFRRAETGLIFGGGASLDIGGGGRMLFEGRYNFGLSSLTDEDDINVHNRGISFTVGFMQPF